MARLGNDGNNVDFEMRDAIRTRDGDQNYTYAKDSALRGSTHQPRDGDAGYSYFVVPDRGPNGEFTTLSEVAEAILKANPSLKDDFPNVQALSDHLELTGNNGGPLYDYTGRLCDETESTFPLIQPGQLLVIPRIENEATLVATRPIQDCVPPSVVLSLTEAENLLNPPVIQTVQDELNIQVANTRQPDEGALGVDIEGADRNAGVQDVANMYRYMGVMPEQPNPAARGRNQQHTGTHTVYGTTAKVVGEVIQSIGPTISLGGVGVFIMPRNDTWGNQSANRLQQAREGGNGTSMQTPGEAPRIDIPFLSTSTRIDGTLLPGTGINVDDEGRVADDRVSPHGNNQFYFGAQGNAGDVPGITMSDHELRTGEANRFTAGRPSDVVPLYGMSNYGVAQFMYTSMNQPGGEVDMLGGKIAEGTANQAETERYIALMRFQQDLVGISNYQITSDIEGLVARERALDARDNVPENDPELLDLQRDFALLNPREQLEFAAQQAQAKAAERGIAISEGRMAELTGNSLTGDDYPVQSLTPDRYRTMMFDYYAEMAVTQEDAFKDVAEREVRAFEAETGGQFQWPGRSDGSRRNRPAGYNESEAREALGEFNQIRDALRANDANRSDAEIIEEALRVALEGGTVGEQSFAPMENDLYEDLEPVVRDVQAYVDNFTDSKEYEQINYERMDEYFRKPQEAFTPAERFELRPAQSAAREQALAGAMGIIAGDAELTRMVLAASDDEPNIAQAFARFDSATVQLPGDYGGGGFDRGNEMDALRARYPAEFDALFGSNFSREEWNGLNREGDALERALAASADDQRIVELRQLDLQRMVTGGSPDDQGYRPGQSAEDLLYGLALEPGNDTWLAIEERIRTTAANEAEAEAQIETLRQGLEYAYNERNTNVRGINQDDLATQIGATEILRDNAASIGEGAGAAVRRERTATATVTEVDQAVRTANLQQVLERLQSDAGAPGMVALATLSGSRAPTNTDDLFVALESLTLDQRAEVFTAGRIEGEAADMWTRILAERSVTTVTTVQELAPELAFDGAKRFTGAMAIEDPNQRVAALIDQYADLPSSERPMAYAVAQMSSGNNPVGGLLTTSVAANVLTANVNAGNSAFTDPLIAQLREQGGDLRDAARDLRGDLRGDMRSAIRDGMRFTKAEDHVPTDGEVAVNVKVSAWTYTLSLPPSDNERVQAWIDRQTPAELQAFVADAVRNANPSSGTARGQMRDIERSVERAIYNEALPSVDDLVAELGADNPYHQLANMLQTQPLDMSELAAFTANPDNAAALASMTNYTLANDFAGVQAFWQAAVDALAVNPNADPFGLAQMVSPANDMQQVAGYNQLILANLTEAIASQDPANTALIRAQTEAALANSPTIPGGIHIPFIPLPAFFRSSETATETGTRIIPGTKEVGELIGTLPRVETFTYDVVTRGTTTILTTGQAAGLNLAGSVLLGAGDAEQVDELPDGVSQVPNVNAADDEQLRGGGRE